MIEDCQLCKLREKNCKYIYTGFCPYIIDKEE